MRGGMPCCAPGFGPCRTRVASSAKASDWNDCANATLVGPATFSELPGKGDDKEAQTLRYVLAGGAPRVVQIQAPEGETDPNYAYAGLRALGADEDGHIVEARVWLAMCGPPPDPKTLLEDDEKPPALPAGLVRARKGPGCMAAKPSAARAAVERSEAWAAGGDMALTARWIRDAD